MRYTLTFGRTVRPADFESIRIEYAQEFDDEQVPREAAYQDVRNFVAGKIEEELSLLQPVPKKPAVPPTVPPAVPTPVPPQVLPRVPTFNLSRMAELPWQAFKEKRPCKPGEAGWIFSNTSGAEDLAKLIDLKGQAVVFMDGKQMACKFSGEDRRFINRAPFAEK